MGNFVLPKVFLLGATSVDEESLIEYLAHTDQLEFLEEWHAAMDGGISPAEALCSFYAKLCYKSLCLGHNDNISKIREIPQNISGTLAQGHNSVFQHVMLNFVVTDCSRVFTHEAVRHRIGTAFSQTSGRYVRSEKLNLVIDPILEPIMHEVEVLQQVIEDWYNNVVKILNLNEMKDFDKKKKITSALRRLLPNGQANEIGISLNITAVRHFIMVRTSRHAEWEIRYIADQIYRIVKAKFPLLLGDAVEEMVGGLYEITGMKMQPY